MTGDPRTPAPKRYGRGLFLATVLGGVSSLAWGLSYQEEERALLGPDPYPYNLDANRHTLETAIAYSHEQGLIRRAPSLEELFARGAAEFPEHVAGGGGVVRAE